MRIKVHCRQHSKISNSLTCLVFCKLTMTSFPPFFLVINGRLPLGSICREVPRHMDKSDCLSRNTLNTCYNQNYHFSLKHKHSDKISVFVVSNNVYHIYYITTVFHKKLCELRQRQLMFLLLSIINSDYHMNKN